MTKVTAIKFRKTSVQDIIDGKKTLERRPRSYQWYKNLEKSDEIHLTRGPRMQKPTIFAHAKIIALETKPFELATQDDLKKIGSIWEGKTVEEFVEVYTDWFEKELTKGYDCYQIEFEVTKVFE